MPPLVVTVGPSSGSLRRRLRALILPISATEQGISAAAFLPMARSDLFTPDSAVMDTLGHRKLSMTLERYTHASDAMQQEAAGTIARQLLRALSDTTTLDGEEAKSG